MCICCPSHHPLTATHAGALPATACLLPWTWQGAMKPPRLVHTTVPCRKDQGPAHITLQERHPKALAWRLLSSVKDTVPQRNPFCGYASQIAGLHKQHMQKSAAYRRYHIHTAVASGHACGLWLSAGGSWAAARRTSTLLTSRLGNILLVDSGSPVWAVTSLSMLHQHSAHMHIEGLGFRV